MAAGPLVVGILLVLRRISDVERIAGRLALRQVRPRELAGLRDTLEELHARKVAYRVVKRATPFGFALMVERFREKVSTEKLSDRVARMVRELEKAAAAGMGWGSRVR